MSGRTPADCPHDLRPGVTVCLHCRYARRIERRNRLLRMSLRIASGALAVVLTAFGATRGSALVFGQTRGGEPVRAMATLDPVPDAPAAAPAPAPAVAEVAPVEVRPGIAPLIPDGRTELGEGMFAERSGDEVIVHFDTPTTRTRRRDKFERIVRQTLPEIFGAAAESLLAGIPAGALSGDADLLTEIVPSGLDLDGGEGWKVVVRPGTRPGQDGPLVVRYAVRIAR